MGFTDFGGQVAVVVVGIGERIVFQQAIQIIIDVGNGAEAFMAGLDELLMFAGGRFNMCNETNKQQQI